MKKLFILRALLALVSTLIFCQTQAHAYIDPGTGSYLFQIALASIFGAIFAVKTFWAQIKEFAKKLLHKFLP